MNKLFDSALAGAKVKATVLLTDGSTVTLSEPMQAWSRSGRVVAQGELSACASAGCGVSLPAGGVVKSVALSATPGLEVRGVFWQSESDLPKAPPPGPSSQVAQNSAGQSKCGAKS
jgi:hypothetical protein